MSAYTISENKCISNEIISSVQGNVECVRVSSRGGAGGYVEGFIKIKQLTRAFATIGGQGIFNATKIYPGSDINYNIENMHRGGYGGGGSSSNYFKSDLSYGAGSGGGQTALKFIDNDLWHRVLVAGGGGGGDNPGGSYFSTDDGSGGAGGNLIAQGYWVNGKYIDSRIANSTFGYTFGSGEAAQFTGSKNTLYGETEATGSSDRSGSGGGWFGGFASHNGNGVSGGGSSWALTRDAIIPESKIEARNEYYELIDSKPYAFNKHCGFIFYHVTHFPGVWSGNGKMIITIVGSVNDFCETQENLLYIRLINMLPIYVFILI